ncbi:hypothetical protein MKS82_06645 [Ochrobactrum sp. A-1]|nr:hypothetical protein [Ochrobactrum sp. A-1]
MIEKEKYRAILVIIIISIVLWFTFYPGFMSHDSIAQFSMSKTLIFSDWHPPIMSWVWSVAGGVFPGPSGMLALHIILVCISVYIWWISYKERSFSWLVFLIPFFPWILNFAGVLWKDVGLAFSLLALSGLALRSPTLGKLFFAFILIFYTINLRYNAIFAVLPILFFLSFRWLQKPSTLKAMLISCVAISVCLFMGGIFNYKILHAERTKPSNYVMVDDLSYLSIKNNKSILPGISIEEIRLCSSADIGQNKLVGRVFCLSNQPSYKQSNLLNADLKRIWLESIIQNPVGYFQFRMAAFSYLLRTPSDAPYYIWHPGVDENSYGIKQDPNGLTLAVEQFVKSSAEATPFFFKPYWWLLASLLLIILSFIFVKTKTIIMVRFLLLSSIFYMFGYIPTTPMADFRYVYWSVIATTMSYLIFFVDNPGINTEITKRRAIWLSVAAFLCCLVVFNYGKLVQINVDYALYNSLDGQRIGAGDPLSKNDLIKGEVAYEVNGIDPFFIYDVASLNLNYRDAHWLKFEFSCLGLTAAPELQLFWWGDDQIGAVEKQKITHGLVEGINLIPLQNHLVFSGLSRLRGVRFDLANPSACKEINFERVEFIGS